ncbi:dephospho-CoA kinase [Salinispirillum marinum]|uniref:Dephospho-CoA kinase n=2 Tax=Saccharospirillaceae TaxID=255527 RepID=A0ABV8BD35_9GAMM
MTKPPVVGLTGGIGSGKTAVSDYLRDTLGVTIVDADVIARDVVAPGQPAFNAIVQRFPDALKVDGTLNRAWLRAHVLPDDDARHWLESVTHPAIREVIEKQLQTAPPPYPVLVSPLLFESGQALLCDYVAVVDAQEQQQIARTSRRDGNDEELIRTIMAKQWPRQRRLENADYIIDNTSSLESLQKATLAFHQHILAKF